MKRMKYLSYKNYFEGLAAANPDILHGVSGVAFAMKSLEEGMSIERTAQGSKPVHLVALMPSFSVKEGSDAEQPYWTCIGGFIIAKLIALRGDTDDAVLGGIDACENIAVDIMNTMCSDSQAGSGPFAWTITGIGSMDATISPLGVSGDNSAAGVLVTFRADMRQILDCE